ncbi:MAG: TonB family protein [Bacteroidaceae bacterium]|nr:TonB family protein [Bacteroidaceae bacterium]
MGPFVAYILKSALVLTLLYSIFALLMSRETLHRINRIALLLMMVLCFVVPSVHLTTSRPMPVNRVFASMDMAFVAQPQVVAESAEPAASWADIVVVVYVAGLVLSGAVMMLQFASLVFQLRRGERRLDDRGNTLLVRDDAVTPFSFMHFIVVGRADAGERSIIVHEQEHIRLRHSLDIVLLRVVQTLQWFNPFVWLLGRDLQTIHEYEADKAVIDRGVCLDEYQQLLIKKAVGNRLQSFANNLNQSSLKKRFTMMYSKKSSKWVVAKYLMVLPVLAATVAVMARPELATVVNRKIDAVAEGKVSKIIATEQVKTEKNAEATVLKSRDTAKGKTLNEVVLVAYPTADKGDVKEKKADFHVFVNGVAMSNESLEAIDPSNVSSISVVKDEKSLRKLGIDDGKGAVLVTLKGNEAAANGRAADGDNDQSPVFDVVEQMPSYPGGQEKMFEFIMANLRYPAEAMKQKTVGRVIVTFVIEKNGAVSNVNVAKGVDPLLDAEAKRVVSIMPHWNPGKQNGKTVRVKYAIPITFQLQ